ncbi:MAG: His-Xaa-Ser system radical SAM maturase HxsB [Candidatus Magasanikbacteria bacterium]|nr:His-Xaa-Ser system radical SAM maturase HxsB [Candidatus Magasanikbacteria bacterium]
MNINLDKIKYDDLANFRFRKLNDGYIITNDNGDFLLMSEIDFRGFLENSLDKTSEIYKSLVLKNFVKEEIDISRAIEKYQSKKSFLLSGPSLHIMIVTLRCDQKCIYCHASAQAMDQIEKDMTAQTAKEALKMIFDTTSPFIAIEFQGGEPLANWPVVKYIIQEAKKLSERFGKELELRLVTNLNLMTEDKYAYLIDNKVSICTSFDGPKIAHDKNRPACHQPSNYENVVRWSKKFRDDYDAIREQGYIWKMSGIAVVSRHNLNLAKEIIDEYLAVGFESVFFRPLNPFGFSRQSWEEIKYSTEEFIEFYRTALDYAIELNLAGTFFVERLAKIFLTKILTDTDPNMMELRSPCGAGIGQLAYNYNGDVYTCDEGRMMSMMGDENFRLGNVSENDYKEVVGSPVVRSLCTASCLEGLSGCSDCAYLPYCGTCPIYNYSEQGNIFGQMPANERCKMNKAILDLLFEKLGDDEARGILETWVE